MSIWKDTMYEEFEDTIRGYQKLYIVWSVSERSEWAIFQLYKGKNKLHIGPIMLMSSL